MKYWINFGTFRNGEARLSQICEILVQIWDHSRNGEARLSQIGEILVQDPGTLIQDPGTSIFLRFLKGWGQNGCPSSAKCAKTARGVLQNERLGILNRIHYFELL